MKHFFLLLCCTISFNLSAQDSNTEKTTLQHSIGACMQGHIFFAPAYGIRYDLRLHTPNPKTDWAFGVTTALGTQTFKYENAFNSNTYWQQGMDYLSLHGLLVFGTKDFAFQTGLVLGYHDTKIRRESFSTYTNQPNYYYEGAEVHQYATAIATAGVRYQSPKNKIHAWADFGGGGYSDLRDVDLKLKYNSPNQQVIGGSIKFQLGVGYTFLSR
jgi:hypothetical protein